MRTAVVNARIYCVVLQLKVGMWRALPPEVKRHIWQFDPTYTVAFSSALAHLSASVRVHTSDVAKVLNAPAHAALFTHADIFGVTVGSVEDRSAVFVIVEDAAAAARVLRSNVLRESGCDGYAIMVASV